MTVFSGAIMVTMGLLGSLFMLLSIAFSVSVGSGAGGLKFIGGGVIAATIRFIDAIRGLFKRCNRRSGRQRCRRNDRGIEIKFAPNA